MEIKMETTTKGCYVGMIENKMETTTMGLYGLEVAP